MSEPRVVILGAGPAGVGAAYQLHRRQRGRATVIEQRDSVGGNAGSFAFAGQRLDYGSHRLHPACDPAILADIERLLGDELLDRPRHGRIRLRGRWIHFPLRPLDLLLRLDPAFAAGAALDMMRRVLPAGERDGPESFASVLRENLGPTICDHFYFPYARKIWGVGPEALSAVQARRRVSAGSFGKLVRKVAGQIPGLKKPGAGRFYYPRDGYGAISEAYERAAAESGAEFLLGWRVVEVRRPETDAEPWRIVAQKDADTRVVEGDLLWSTIPITLLARLSRPEPPAEVLRASAGMDYRSMLLVYLQLPVDRFTEYDAHYFPGENVAITRLSEPKNYAALEEPRGSTVICAELPCTFDDAHWNARESELAEVVAADLERAGIPLPAAPRAVHVRRLRHAYPIYLSGYEEPFEVLDDWAAGQPRLLTYGRQGLFAHDNTHHALYMAYSAVDCVGETGFDRRRWTEYREEFETHVVED